MLTLFLEPIASLRLFWTIFEFFAIKAAALDICRLLSISIKIHMLKTQFLNENTFYLILCSSIDANTEKYTSVWTNGIKLVTRSISFLGLRKRLIFMKMCLRLFVYKYLWWLFSHGKISDQLSLTGRLVFVSTGRVDPDSSLGALIVYGYSGLILIMTW